MGNPIAATAGHGATAEKVEMAERRRPGMFIEPWMAQALIQIVITAAGAALAVMNLNTSISVIEARMGERIHSLEQRLDRIEKALDEEHRKR